MTHALVVALFGLARGRKPSDCKHRPNRLRVPGFHFVLCAALFFGPQATWAAGVQNPQLAKVANTFVAELGVHYPTEATELGDHAHDTELEDWSPAGVAQTLAWLSGLESKLSSLTVQARSFTADDSFDLSVLRHEIGRRKFLLTEYTPHRQKPTFYTGLLSDSVSALLKRNFAPKKERLRATIARLNKGAAMIRQAPRQLTQLTQSAVDVALRTLPATIGFFKTDVVQTFADVKDAELQDELRKASDEVCESLGAFSDWLKQKRATASPHFALGEALFARALFAEEMIDEKVADLLPRAEAELARLRLEFDKTAARIDPHRTAEETQLLVSQDHPQPQQIIEYTASRQAAQQRFLIDHEIVTVPKDVLPFVRETPPFMRATTLASMDTPGPYEKSSEAFYYVTLPDPGFSPAETEDFLRGAHNRPLIDVVTIHEAFPGHYVQYLWLSRLSPARKMALSMANAEGWAHYAEEMMMEAGYAQGRPKVRLMQLQDALLRAARFVAGIKMHCRGMTQTAAEDFFHKEGRQTRAVAEVEARRGTQDPMYVVYTYGKLEILKMRSEYKAQQGAQFKLRKFHDTLLGYGRAPLTLIRRAMLGE